MRTVNALGIMVATGTILLASPNFAQAANAATVGDGAGQTSELAEIIVTAEKRSTLLERTPIAVTALSGDALQNDQARTLNDMQSLIPSFQFGSQITTAQLSIRGIGTQSFIPGVDAPVAVNLNGVNIARPSAVLGSLFDVSSIEVLRGPQGTLYGRNATAGTVNVSTNLPTDTLSGYARTTVGNYDDLSFEGAIGGPIVGDTLMLRVAGFSEKRGGYGQNVVTGNPVDDKDTYGGRATLVFVPSENFKATLIGDYSKEDDHGGALHYLGAAGLLPLPGTTGGPPGFILFHTGTAPANILDVSEGADYKFLSEIWGAAGVLEWSQGNLGIKSVTGYRNQKVLSFTPLDAGGSVLNNFVTVGELAHQVSEELQLHYDTHALHATAGLYYFNEHDTASPYTVADSSNYLYPVFGLPPPPNPYYDDFVNLGGRIITNARAAFTEGSYEFENGFALTAGLRYSEETKHLTSWNSVDLTLSRVYPYNPAYPFASPPEVPVVDFPTAKFTATTPKLGIQYQADPSTFLYATYAKGFKSGGFDISTQDPAFKPEELTSYEVGLKKLLLQDRLTVNLTAFHYDYNDLQVQQVVGFAVGTVNAATAKVNGVEFETNYRPINSLTLSGYLSFLHARYDKFTGYDSAQPNLPSVVFNGNALSEAPDWRGHLSAEYRWSLPDGTLALRGEGDYSSRYYFTPANLALLSQGAYAKANLFLSYTTHANWQVTGFVRNVTNKITVTNGFVLAADLGTPAVGTVAPPRTYGAELAYHF
jgi:iron complex outermembrane recepter protein